MEQYIPKSVVLAEIKKLIDEIYAGRPFDALSSGQQTALWYIKSIMSSIDTLEVKEVDFIKEFYAFSEKHKLMDKDIEFSDIEKTASFFFQLGLKAQKGE